ncbi:MerR family transcriptional regulator [Streptomyces sp. NBC_00193]|uniref:MerR family transcriptional regulator n=1 Tax=unclassified Streptomyces TaxID=2593676 RepID=UPI002252C5B9|nr:MULTISPECIES: MerR family transcriptional regulator [unclassified Streptomyces]MCX5130093.1 MerR family transcriptional regulator [Streptomyces sp. NBC_00347]MCX5301131.1 MerR family transcriptional regulator [Streptomyces sp. NBC_00193]
MSSQVDQDAAVGGHYRRDEVARAAGVKVRNLRYYQERGLLPPPRREGRIAWYSDDHLTRLRLINDLLGRGYTVNGIAELLAAWEQGGGLSQLLGLEREMTRDWEQEDSVVMSRTELRDLFGPTASPEDTRRAAELGYVTIDGDLVTHRSRRLLEATVTLVRAGVPLAEVLDAGEFVQTQAAAVADRFVALFSTHVIGTDGLEQLSATRLQHITEAVAALRPLAGEVVATEFARAMARRVDAEVAGLLRTESPGA